MSAFPALCRLQVTSTRISGSLPPALGALPGSYFVEGVVDRRFDRSDRAPVALDPGGDLAGWAELGWLDRYSGLPLSVTTDPLASAGTGAVLLVTLDDKAVAWSRRPRTETISEVVVDSRLVVHLGRLSGVIDADDAGEPGDPARARPVYDPGDLPASLRDPSSRTPLRSCAREGCCEVLLGRPQSLYCSERCKKAAKRARAADSERGVLQERIAATFAGFAAPDDFARHVGLSRRLAADLAAGDELSSAVLRRAVAAIERSGPRRCRECAEVLAGSRRSWCSDACRMRVRRRAAPHAVVPLDRAPGHLPAADALADFVARLARLPGLPAGAEGRLTRSRKLAVALARHEAAGLRPDLLLVAVEQDGPLGTADRPEAALVARVVRAVENAISDAERSATAWRRQAQILGEQLRAMVRRGEQLDVAEAELDHRYGDRPELHAIATAALCETLG